MGVTNRDTIRPEDMEKIVLYTKELSLPTTSIKSRTTKQKRIQREQKTKKLLDALFLTEILTVK